MIISRTPYRISLFGGGTDYPGWYRNHGGAVLATTIDKYCYISCRHLPPFFDHRYRIAYSVIEACQTVDEIRHPVVREVLRRLGSNRGVEIHHDGDLPARSGMGSSSSFTIGLLNAMHALEGHMTSKHELALEGIEMEQVVLQETVGAQDQVSAAYGGFNLIHFHRDGQIEVAPMTLGRDRIQELSSHLVLLYTGIKRTAADVASTFTQDLESRAKELHQMRASVDQAVEILRGPGIEDIGKLMHECWLAKRSLSSRVSNSYVDEMYAEARAAGAIGGKLIGAGGGGFMLLFAAPSRHRAIRERLRKLVHVPFKFEMAGSQIIVYDLEADYASDEETRLRQSIAPFREEDALTRER